MAESWRLELEVLDSHVLIRSDDPRLLPIFQRLWEPFFSSRRTPGLEIVIESRPRGQWDMIFDDDEPVGIGNLWWMLIGVRNELMLRTTSRARSVVGIHAAVVAKNGAALLLAGDPWSGKTTFTLRLVELGWSYMSDDVAPIECDTGSVRPFPKPLAIKTKPWDEMRHLWEPIPEFLTPPQTVFLVPAGGLLPRPLRNAIPACIVFLSYQEGADARLRPLTPAEALTRCLHQATRTDAAAVATLRKLCEAIGALELVHGGAEGGVDELHNHLARLDGDVYAFCQSLPAVSQRE